MDFELVHIDECTHARAGVITTDHGKIQTPILLPGNGGLGQGRASARVEGRY